MEHQVTKIADCEYELRIQLRYDEAAPVLEEAYEAARRDITIEGFRKGKAPLELIKQRYGAKIEAEALENLGRQMVRELARQNRWALLSEPQLIDLQRSPESIGFTFRYYTLPELTIDLSDITLRKPVRAIPEEEVDSQLEELRLRYGTVRGDVDCVADYHHEVTLHFQPADPETGMPLVGEEAEELTIALYDPETLPDLRQRLLNTCVGESFLYSLPETDTGQPSQTYQVTVRAIRQIQPAEFTPEFVQHISGGQLRDIEELRQYIRQELQRQHELYAQSVLRNQLELELARRYPFVPPKPIVHSIARDLVASLQRGELRVPAEYLREGETGVYRFLTELANFQARLAILELLLLQQYQIQLSPEELQNLAQSLRLSVTELEKRLQEDVDLEYDLRRRKLWQFLLQNVHVEPVAADTDAGHAPHTEP